MNFRSCALTISFYVKFEDRFVAMPYRGDNAIISYSSDDFSSPGKIPREYTQTLAQLRWLLGVSISPICAAAFTITLLIFGGSSKDQEKLQLQLSPVPDSGIPFKSAKKEVPIFSLISTLQSLHPFSECHVSLPAPQSIQKELGIPFFP